MEPPPGPSTGPGTVRKATNGTPTHSIHGNPSIPIPSSPGSSSQLSDDSTHSISFQDLVQVVTELKQSMITLAKNQSLMSQSLLKVDHSKGQSCSSFPQRRVESPGHQSQIKLRHGVEFQIPSTLHSTAIIAEVKYSTGAKEVLGHGHFIIPSGSTVTFQTQPQIQTFQTLRSQNELSWPPDRRHQLRNEPNSGSSEGNNNPNKPNKQTIRNRRRNFVRQMNKRLSQGSWNQPGQNSHQNMGPRNSNYSGTPSPHHSIYWSQAESPYENGPSNYSYWQQN